MARALLLASFCLLTGCRSFDCQKEQVFLRYRPQADVLDVVLAYEGVGAVDDHVDETSRVVAGLAHGERHFMIWDWPLDFDLSEIVQHVHEHPQQDEWTETERALLAYESSISVVAARSLREGGPHGRLCVLQRLRFERGRDLLKLVDAFVNAGLLEDARAERDARRRPVRDPVDLSTQQLRLARASANGSWARFEGAELVVSLPMTSAEAARELQELLEGAGSSARDHAFLQVFGALSALRVGEDETLLRFAPGADGWIRLEFSRTSDDYDGEVAERLEVTEPLPVGELAAEIERLKSGA